MDLISGWVWFSIFGIYLVLFKATDRRSNLTEVAKGWGSFVLSSYLGMILRFGFILCFVLFLNYGLLIFNISLVRLGLQIEDQTSRVFG